MNRLFFFEEQVILDDKRIVLIIKFDPSQWPSDIPKLKNEIKEKLMEKLKTHIKNKPIEINLETLIFEEIPIYSQFFIIYKILLEYVYKDNSFT